jgi:hypothetical protein
MRRSYAAGSGNPTTTQQVLYWHLMTTTKAHFNHLYQFRGTARFFQEMS